MQEFGAGSDRLFSASLDPGARLFQAPLVVDLNVGEATATYPSIAMNEGGNSYLAYRVATSSSTPFPGYVDSDVRVARYNGSLWSVVGSVDRNPVSPVATPTAENSPKVGIDVSGNGLVAWQEPDDDFFDRIWARRVFGSTLGVPLLVSPQSLNGAPLQAPADALSVDQTGFGQGAVAFRQQPGPGSGLNGAHVFVNTIPEAFTDQAGTFEGPRLADGSAGVAPGGPLGVPRVGVTPEGDVTLTWGAGNASMSARAFGRTFNPPSRLDDGGGAVSGEPAVEVADSGASVISWRARTRNVAVQERPLAGGPVTVNVNPASSQPVSPPLLAGSGLGDAIAAYRAGDNDSGRIEASIVDAPPLEFEVQTPISFVRKKRVGVTWDPAPNAIGGVTYTVASGNQELATGLTRRSLRMLASDLGDGRHRLRVFAVDSKGQETAGLEGVVRLDRTKPRVRVRTLRRHRVQVRVLDGVRGQSSGVRAARTSVSFGDGKRMRRRARTTHRYKRRGSYRLVVKAADRAGNRVTVNRRVRVR